MTNDLAWFAIVFLAMDVFSVLLSQGVSGLLHPFDLRSARNAPEPVKVVGAHVFLWVGLGFAPLTALSAALELIR